MMAGDPLLLLLVLPLGLVVVRGVWRGAEDTPTPYWSWAFRTYRIRTCVGRFSLVTYVDLMRSPNVKISDKWRF